MSLVVVGGGQLWSRFEGMCQYNSIHTLWRADLRQGWYERRQELGSARRGAQLLESVGRGRAATKSSRESQTLQLHWDVESMTSQETLVQRASFLTVNARRVRPWQNEYYEIRLIGSRGTSTSAVQDSIYCIQYISITKCVIEFRACCAGSLGSMRTSLGNVMTLGSRVSP